LLHISFIANCSVTMRHGAGRSGSLCKSYCPAV
jgi:hypothetical protein